MPVLVIRMPDLPQQLYDMIFNRLPDIGENKVYYLDKSDEVYILRNRLRDLPGA
jgi:hypothetical protein